MSSNTELKYLYKEDRGYIAISYNTFIKAFELHIQIPIWGKTIQERYSQFKECQKIFENIRKGLKDSGITEVIGLSRTGKEAKFNMMFGFKYTGYTAHTVDGIEKAILHLEL